jgi:hypothetical protein
MSVSLTVWLKSGICGVGLTDCADDGFEVLSWLSGFLGFGFMLFVCDILVR